ncbi:thioredoxin-like negative regulator of GroEL [Dysgonomonas hofstadii]|uniref:Thioredoxin-like negative regulator of GroEL n=1 Tax=Dysgonomonas hofstadii TaxID=637886 RepID=A0A840CQ35_9BACT|nr:thioredoxin family protein [Dysgonomonas hofstadii]MBB4037536.1 thioredoxin-like negative regulator of GroEL [Dysgonomonas hofstadii]
MKELNNFRFKTWHFILLLAIMFVSTNILGNINIKRTPAYLEETCFVEIDDSTFGEAISSDISFVLFYKEDSDLCTRMEYNVNRLAELIQGEKVNFYKLDIEKYPGRYSKYDMSGTPSIIIYKRGKEIERLMGIVPVSNLEIIYNRVVK